MQPYSAQPTLLDCQYFCRGLRIKSQLSSNMLEWPGNWTRTFRTSSRVFNHWTTQALAANITCSMIMPYLMSASISKAASTSYVSKVMAIITNKQILESAISLHLWRVAVAGVGLLYIISCARWVDGNHLFVYELNIGAVGVTVTLIEVICVDALIRRLYVACCSSMWAIVSWRQFTSVTEGADWTFLDVECSGCCG